MTGLGAHMSLYRSRDDVGEPMTFHRGKRYFYTALSGLMWVWFVGLLTMSYTVGPAGNRTCDSLISVAWQGAQNQRTSCAEDRGQETRALVVLGVATFLGMRARAAHTRETQNAGADE